MVKKILFILSIFSSLIVHGQKYKEYEVKAAFLERFTRFVEWPDSTHMKDIDKPFVIGILGNNPFKSILEKTYAKQKIKDKKVEIRNLSELIEADDCNLLFISGSEYKRIDQISAYLEKKPILTVCDNIRYSKRGIQVILFIENNQVYFEIDQNAVNQSGLYMNSLLIKMSKSIN
jgi:hypothetical protein